MRSLFGYNRVYFASHLQGLSEYLHGQSRLPGIESGLEWIEHEKEENQSCFSEVIGQYHAKHGLEIAAAGNHNILLLGPPGTGKSMLASRMMQLLPPLGYDEAFGGRNTALCCRTSDHPNAFYTRPFRKPTPYQLCHLTCGWRQRS